MEMKRLFSFIAAIRKNEALFRLVFQAEFHLELRRFFQSLAPSSIQIYIIYLYPRVFHLRPEAVSSRPDHRSGFPARDAAISSNVSGFLVADQS